jgi:CheY-like chemotaxis protein
MKREAVLIVEDDAALRETLCMVLADAGYTAATASDGVEALRYLASVDELPCMILLDLMMPEMDGWQFRAVQAGDPRLSRICTAVLTANKSKPVQADHHLAKPISLAALLDVVAQCCERQGHAAKG